MLKVPEAFRAEFEEELAERTVLGAQIGCLLLIFLFPLFGILDFVMYPHVAREMGLLRLLITPMEIGNLILMRAVDGFDIHRGHRFSTYATLALMKGFARAVPQMLAADRRATHDEGEAASTRRSS